MIKIPNKEYDYLKILDLLHCGNWEEAHKLIQLHSDEFSCLIHAYLHRVEGNIINAKYWYNYVGMRMPENSLEEEFNHLYETAKQLLKDIP